MKKWMLLILILIGTYVALYHTSLLTKLMPPDMRLPDNSTYHGELKDGLFHGRGELQWADGGSYVGKFQNGLMHGEGELIEPNGTRHKGLYQNGMMHGKGHIKFAEGGSYFGEFDQNQMTGEGMMVDAYGNQYQGQFESGMLVQGTEKDSDGNVYEGSFKKGLLDGQGTLFTSEGDTYKGEFEAGVLHGKGHVFKGYGDRYEGELEDWVYSGEGELVDYHGDRYVGSFEHGLFHGEGVLTLAEPIDGISEVAGVWEYGFHPDDPRDQSWYAPTEGEAMDELLYSQLDLLQQQFDGLLAGQEAAIELYFLGAAWHQESVFNRELDFIQDVMNAQFDTLGRSVTLYNHTTKKEQKPLATETALKLALDGLAAKMDVTQDVLFLYLTSHGQPDELSVSFPGLTLSNIEAERLGTLLKDSPIRWKVIMISACYSGSFIDELASDQHLIMTASREDRVSFGCGEDSEMTYFAKAMFKESMHLHDSFEAAFEAAKSLITKWEDEELFGQEHSEPQISMGSLIAPHLQKWRAQQQPLSQ